MLDGPHVFTYRAGMRMDYMYVCTHMSGSRKAYMYVLTGQLGGWTTCTYLQGR